jgi:hypothetical protein
MHITIEPGSYYAIADHCFLAIQGENNTRSVFLTHPEVSGADGYYLRIQISESLIYDLPITGASILLPASVTAIAGTVSLQWIAKSQDGSVIAKSQVIPALIQESIDGDSTSLPTPEIFQSQYDRVETVVNHTESLLQALNGDSTEDCTRLYVDTDAGSDDNDAKTIDTAVQTLDRALLLSNAYRNATICLKRGQCYQATDTNNEYGKGLHFYSRSIRFEAIKNNDSEKAAPKIQNTIYLHHGALELSGVDLASSHDGIYLYHSFCTLTSCSITNVACNNSITRITQPTITQVTAYGGYTTISGGKIVSSVQVSDGGYLNYGNCSITGFVKDSTSIICENGMSTDWKSWKQNSEAMLQAATIYVNATSGSDNNSGDSESTAFLTLEKAYKSVQYNKKAVIYLAAGTYTFPNKILSIVGTDLHIYGNSASDTTIKGNLVADNCCILLARITFDSSDSETASTTASTITTRYNTNIRISDCNFYTASGGTYSVKIDYSSRATLTNVVFYSTVTRSIIAAGSSDVRLYNCVDYANNGGLSGTNCMLYLTRCKAGSDSKSDFSYTNSNYGMVFVNGQQVLPQTSN